MRSEASKVASVFLFWFKSCSKPESGNLVTSGRRTRDWQTRLMESSSALSGGLFSYAPDTFCSNDATFVEARENENMVLVLHSTGSCKRNAVLLGANFILKGHENGAITGHNGHENGAITGQKKT